MSTTIVFEQHPTYLFQHCSCTSLYLHVLLGVLAVSLLWFALTLVFVKPPARDIPSRRPPMSFKSNSSILVVDKLPKDVSTRDTISTGNILKQKSETLQPISEDIPSSKAVSADPSDGFITFNNPFSDVSAPVKISSSPSLALYPFVRRMSLPRHRSSSKYICMFSCTYPIILPIQLVHLWSQFTHPLAIVRSDPKCKVMTSRTARNIGVGNKIGRAEN
ncbi:hypothetical protein H2248_012029 [Termitomyces sp. 'cryptogamus']|nr:hypothetical protein H2248_012029 [Termitomyces sp. 'cryptogamus']